MDSSDDTDPPKVRRRNSLATSVVAPTKLSLSTATAKARHSASFPVQNGAVVPSATSLDLELMSLKSSLSYTSLKDLLPSSPSGAGAGGINSPTAAGSSEISIRNRLVKQAAWAYLQPMSSSPSSAAPRFFRRLWLRFSSQSVVASCLSFVSRAVDRLLRALRVRTDS